MNPSQRTVATPSERRRKREPKVTTNLVKYAIGRPELLEGDKQSFTPNWSLEVGKKTYVENRLKVLMKDHNRKEQILKGTDLIKVDVLCPDDTAPRLYDNNARTFVVLLFNGNICPW